MLKRISTWLLLAFALASTAALAQTPAVITSPMNGSTLSGPDQTFQWNAAPGGSLYQLWVGTAPGTHDLGFFPMGGTSGTMVDVTGLPTDGSTLYVTLWSMISGTYYSSDATYMAASGASGPASITSPMNGATLAGSTQTFTWNAAPGAMLYQLWVGTMPGADDIGFFPAAGTTGTSVMVSGLPTDGRTLYVRLWSAIGGTYQSRDFVYMAASAPSAAAAAALSSPMNGSVLAASQTFQWNAAPGAMLYQLWVGTTPGAYDVGFFPASGTTDTSVMVSLPTGGGTLYVRLWTALDSGYVFNDYTFMAPPAPQAGEISWPAQGSSLAGATDTFRWNAAPGAYGYQLWVGSTAGNYDIGFYPDGLTSDTMVSPTGLPTDGRQLYVRLWTATMDGYSFSDSTFYAKGPFVSDPDLPMPGLGWTLPGPAQAFDVGLSTRASPTLSIGNSVGSSEFGFGSRGGLQTTFTNLPVDGRALFARLGWNTSNGARFRDYPLTAAPAGPGAVMLSPANDFGLFGVGTSFSFTFSDVGATAYKLWAGTTLGGQEYGEFPGPAGTTSTTISVTVPAGQVPTHIRVWSLVAGVWYFRDYHYELSSV